MAEAKVVLITGCSHGGLGDALARAYHARGYRVIATARDLQKMKHLQSLNIETLALDVLSSQSIQKCVKDVEHLTGGKLNVLLNNSGQAFPMPIVDASLQASRELFDLNVWAAVEMIQAFLPLLLRSAPDALIVNNTSIASISGPAAQGIYNASKAALAMITSNLRLELESFGIKVVDLKTGSVHSNFFQAVQAKGQSKSGGQSRLPDSSIYSVARDAIESAMYGKGITAVAMDADQWARKVVADLTVRNPSPSIYRGGNAWVVWFATSFVPAKFLDPLLSKLGGMDVLAARLKGQK